MKLVLALAVLATSAASLASSRDIYDVMYLPNAGKTYGFTTGSLLTGRIKGDGFKTDLDGYNIEQTVGHSLTDRFSLQASLNYTKLTMDPNVGDKTDQKGISDPTVTARFRMMDEDNLRWDIIGGALVSVGDSKTKSNGDLNNLKGRSELFIGTQIGQKSENFQWSLLGQFQRDLKATNKVSGGDTVKDDAHNEWLFRADFLNKLAEKSFIRSHLSADFIDKYDSNDDTTTASQTGYEIGAEYQHLMSADLLLRAGIDYHTINTLSGLIDDYNYWVYKIGANYQF